MVDIDKENTNIGIQIFGTCSYLYFFYIFCYLLFWLCNAAAHYPESGFVTGLFPCTVDFGCPDTNFDKSLGGCIVVNLILASCWAVHHSLFARPFVKAKLYSCGVPYNMERSLYVLCASGITHLIYAFWQPITDKIWGKPDAGIGSYVGILLGWLIVFLSTLMIDHFDLFGLRQIFQLWPASEGLQMKAFYKFVRHPIMLGFYICWWATPYMTAGRLMFVLLVSGYIVVGVFLEEMDLINMFGDEYLEYKRTTGGILPMCPFGYFETGLIGPSVTDTPATVDAEDKLAAAELSE